MEKIWLISKQAGFQLFGKIISIFSTFIILSLVTHHYSQSGTGIFTLATTYLAFFYLFADLGLNGYFLPRVEKDKKDYSFLFTFRVFWSIVLIGIANIVVFFLPFRNALFQQAVFIGSFSILFNSLFTTFTLYFQSKLRYDLVTTASVIGSLVVIPVAFIIVQSSNLISALLWTVVLNLLISALFAYIFILKDSPFRFITLSLNYIKQIAKESWPIALTLILNLVYFRSDAFILTSYTSFNQTGIYNLSYQLFQNILVIPTFIMNSYYPLMLQSFKQDKVKFLSELKIGLILLGTLSLLGIFSVFLFSPFIIKIIAGEPFTDSIVPLQILSFGFPAYFLTSLLMWVFMVYKKYKSMLLIYIIGLIANIMLNFLFIPQYGYIAASWITGISEYLILILQIIILYPVFKKYELSN